MKVISNSDLAQAIQEIAGLIDDADTLRRYAETLQQAAEPYWRNVFDLPAWIYVSICLENKPVQFDKEAFCGLVERVADVACQYAGAGARFGRADDDCHDPNNGFGDQFLVTIARADGEGPGVWERYDEEGDWE